MKSGPYWRKAPLGLLRRPPLFAAVFAGALLVALAAASSTLFSTAAGNAALRSKLTQITPTEAGLYVFAPGGRPASRDVQGQLAERAREVVLLRKATSGIPALEQPVATLLGDPVLAAGDPVRQTILVRPVARTDFAVHQHRVSGGGAGGFWLATTTARFLGVRAGGRLLVLPVQPTRSGRSGFGPPVALRVAATYTPLWAEPDTAYWANFAQLIYPPPPGQDGVTPPTFLLGSPRQVLSLAERAHSGAGMAVEFPIRTRGITLREAERIERRFDAVVAEVKAGRSPLARSLGCSPSSAVNQCDGHTSLRSAIALARRNVDAVSAPTRLLADVGLLISLGVFAAAGAFLVLRRRAEARLLYARGTASSSFAAHTALEALVPTLLGAAGGFGVALGLVRLAQPSGALDGVALRSAAARAAIAAAVGLALLAVIATASFLRQYEATSWSSRRLGLLPWELPLLGVGVWLLVDVAHGGGIVGRGSAGGLHPSLEIFLVPLLLLAGVAGLVLRVVRAGLVRAARRDAPLPLYLALRRLAAGRGPLVLLVTLCTVALGLLFYAQTLASSLSTSAREKAYVAVGSDVAGTINADDPLPRRFPYPLTKAEVSYAAATVGGATGSQIDVIGVDPRTLGSVIRWDASWGPAPGRWLPQLGSSLPLPVVVTRGLRRIDAIWVAQQRVPVRVVASVRAFPGMTDAPLVVASSAGIQLATARAGARGAISSSSALVWARGPARAVEAALAASPLRPYYPITVDDVLHDPDIAVATRTFSFLRGLGFAIGALALVGVLLHLYARQRGQAIASAFSRRMGLGRRAELLALWCELAGLLLLAAGLAAIVAVSAAGPVVRHTDPIPIYQPGPVVVVPWLWIWATLAGSVVFALAGAALAAALARRADVGEELRLA